jgi:hypothetical protein
MGGAAGITQGAGQPGATGEQPTSTVTDTERDTRRTFWSRNAHCSKCRGDLEDGEPVYRARVGRGGTMYTPCHYAIEQFCKTCAPPSGFVPAHSMHMVMAGIVRFTGAGILEPTELPQGEYYDGGPCEVCGRHVMNARGWALGGKKLISPVRRRTHCLCSPACERSFWSARQREKRLAREQERQKTCPVCGKSFLGTRRDASTCSSACRQKAYRRRSRGRD